jgi:hypothetical protein
MADRRPRKGASWLLLLFVILLMALLWPPFYNLMDPQVAGIPFFYWFQLSSIIVTVGLTLVAYLGRA